MLVRRVNAQAASNQGIDIGGLEHGSSPPDFHAETLRGDQATLSTYTGRKRGVVFLFFSAHCGPCRDILATLKGGDAGLSRSGIDLVLVSGDEREHTEPLLKELQVNLPTLIAPREHNSFFTDYKISMTPSYCLLNEDGRVQHTGIPGSGEDAWQILLNSWKTSEFALSR